MRDPIDVLSARAGFGESNPTLLTTSRSPRLLRIYSMDSTRTRLDGRSVELRERESLWRKTTLRDFSSSSMSFRG